MKKVIAILFFLLAACTVIFLLSHSEIQKKTDEAKITTFEQCAAAGYSVMESYPEQCRTPSGKFFVKQLIPER